MKIRQFIGVLLLAGTALIASCAQDAVFATIQYDKPLKKDAVVPGGPTAIVEAGGALYVGSNYIYRYAPTEPGEESRWMRLPNQPGGTRIMKLAGTDTYLYALVMTGPNLSDSKLVRLNAAGGSWETVDKNGHPAIQGIYGAGDTLFAGADSGEKHLLSIADTAASPALTLVPNASGTLKAAAKHNGTYYVSLDGVGILKAASPQDLSNGNILQYDGGSPGNFLGFIEVGGELIAVSGGGWLWRIDGDGVVYGKNYGTLLNGALAKWKNPDPVIDSGKAVDLLLLGRQAPGGSSTSSYYYGYSELPTGTDGKISGDLSLQKPGLPQGGVPSSVAIDDEGRTYENTLGNHAVNHLYQAPWDKVLFASTQQSGLWSCRGDPLEWDIE